MNISKLLKRPLNNQKGFAIIIMISLISVTVVSYTLYASNYFLLLTHEVKQAKRTINGINVLQQVAQTMYRARLKHYQMQVGAAANCAAQDPDYPTPLHEICVPDLSTKADGLCIANPFVDPPVLCIRAVGAGGTGLNILEVTGYEEPTWYDPYVKPILRDFNDFSYSYGKTMVSLAEELSNRAIAYPEPDELPTLAGAPTLTKNPNVNKPCGAGDTPSEECMRCRDHDLTAPYPAADSRRPECFTLKVCIRADDGVAAGVAGDGFADCDPAVNEQWIWQMVAITNPVGP